jgi:hypothetical protein
VVNLAVSFRNEESCVLDELVLELLEEEIVFENTSCRLGHLFSCAFEVNLSVQLAKEFSDCIRVLVLFLTEGTNDISNGFTRSGSRRSGRGTEGRFAGDDDGSDEVTKEPRSGSLEGVEVVLVEPRFEESFTTVGVVVVDEERPVEPPGALLESDERSSRSVRTALIDEFTETSEFFESGVP